MFWKKRFPGGFRDNIGPLSSKLICHKKLLFPPWRPFPCSFSCCYWESVSLLRGDIKISIPSDRKFPSVFPVLKMRNITRMLESIATPFLKDKSSWKQIVQYCTVLYSRLSIYVLVYVSIKTYLGVIVRISFTRCSIFVGHSPSTYLPTVVYVVHGCLKMLILQNPKI